VEVESSEGAILKKKNRETVKRILPALEETETSAVYRFFTILLHRRR